MSIKRFAIAVAVAVGILSIGSGRTEALTPPEGCVVTDGNQCRYRAHQVGSLYAAGNNWYVQIDRGKETIQFWSQFNAVLFKQDFIKPGDRVFGTTGLAWPQRPCAIPGGTGVVKAGPDIDRNLGR